MFRFFRTLRRRLLAEKQVSRYLLYAIGEILLVVIGILIALQVDTWNDARLDRLQEIEALKNLKSELQGNLADLKHMDSIYASREESTAKGLAMLNGALTVGDLKALNSSIGTIYQTFPLAKSAYEEMLNTGTFYKIKDEKLKSEITDFYLLGDRWATAFLEINRESQIASQNPALFGYYYMLDQLKSPSPDLRGIDTLWIQDRNSPTFLALHHSAKIYQDQSNTARRILIARHIEKSEGLIRLIETYLNQATP